MFTEPPTSVPCPASADGAGVAPVLTQDCVTQYTCCCNKQALRFQWLHPKKVHFSLRT